MIAYPRTYTCTKAIGPLGGFLWYFLENFFSPPLPPPGVIRHFALFSALLAYLLAAFSPRAAPLVAPLFSRSLLFSSCFCPGPPKTPVLLLRLQADPPTRVMVCPVREVRACFIVGYAQFRRSRRTSVLAPTPLEDLVPGSTPRGMFKLQPQTQLLHLRICLNSISVLHTSYQHVGSMHWTTLAFCEFHATLQF